MKFSLLLRYFTFWFLIISLAICINEYIGGDNKHLLFFSFGLDPITNNAVYTEPYRSIIFDSDKITYLGYALHISLAILYGLCLDLIKFGCKKINAYFK